MRVIFARNVNDAYRQGLTLLRDMGKELPSRVGPVLRVPSPVTTVYRVPQERVIFDAQRDANPFFHLFEALWMLNGGNDLRTLTHFLKSFESFSDDGETLHGAYGYRWRHAGEGEDVDQIATAIGLLAENPSDRRVIIQMWDVNKDLAVNSKDIPCNDMIKCAIVEEALDITVFCRSNDAIYGAYGANAVHLSVLHEYLASMLGVPIGTYTQISCDFHAYLETPYTFTKYFPLRVRQRFFINPYNEGLHVIPLVEDANTFDAELETLMECVKHWTVNPQMGFKNAFFERVALPMYYAFRYVKDKDYKQALACLHVERDAHIDWLVAAEEWIMRRLEKQKGIQ